MSRNFEPNRPPHRAHVSRALRTLACGLLAAVLLALAPPARAQHNTDFALTYTQERSKFAGNYCQCFYLRGATADIGYSFYKGLGIAGSGTGVSATNLHGSIDIHQISLLVGPRYTYNLGNISPTTWGRHGGVFLEGKVGYTFATAGLYPVGGTLADHASALTYQGGGGINLTVFHRFDLRLIEADYVRTQLPNGINDRQNTLRMASGINFHFGR